MEFGKLYFSLQLPVKEKLRGTRSKCFTRVKLRKYIVESTMSMHKAGYSSFSLEDKVHFFSD
jgi:hypothetical protein